MLVNSLRKQLDRFKNQKENIKLYLYLLRKPNEKDKLLDLLRQFNKVLRNKSNTEKSKVAPHQQKSIIKSKRTTYHSKITQNFHGGGKENPIKGH